MYFVLIEKKDYNCIENTSIESREAFMYWLAKKNLLRTSTTNIGLATHLSKKVQNHLSVKSRQELCNILLNFLVNSHCLINCWLRQLFCFCLWTEGRDFTSTTSCWFRSCFLVFPEKQKKFIFISLSTENPFCILFFQLY